MGIHCDDKLQDILLDSDEVNGDGIPIILAIIGINCSNNCDNKIKNDKPYKNGDPY